MHCSRRDPQRSVHIILLDLLATGHTQFTSYHAYNDQSKMAGEFRRFGCDIGISTTPTAASVQALQLLSIVF